MLIFLYLFFCIENITKQQRHNKKHLLIDCFLQENNWKIAGHQVITISKKNVWFVIFLVKIIKLKALTKMQKKKKLFVFYSIHCTCLKVFFVFTKDCDNTSMRFCTMAQLNCGKSYGTITQYKIVVPIPKRKHCVGSFWRANERKST